MQTHVPYLRVRSALSFVCIHKPQHQTGPKPNWMRFSVSNQTFKSACPDLQAGLCVPTLQLVIDLMKPVIPSYYPSTCRRRPRLKGGQSNFCRRFRRPANRQLSRYEWTRWQLTGQMKWPFAWSDFGPGQDSARSSCTVCNRPCKCTCRCRCVLSQDETKTTVVNNK